VPYYRAARLQEVQMCNCMVHADTANHILPLLRTALRPGIAPPALNPHAKHTHTHLRLWTPSQARTRARCSCGCCSRRWGGAHARARRSVLLPSHHGLAGRQPPGCKHTHLFLHSRWPTNTFGCLDHIEGRHLSPAIMVYVGSHLGGSTMQTHCGLHNKMDEYILVHVQDGQHLGLAMSSIMV